MQMAGSEAPQKGTGYTTVHVSLHSACNAPNLTLDTRLAMYIVVQCNS